MKRRSAICLVLAVFAAATAGARDGRAQDVEKYTVYCADRRIEISSWDLVQMKVRRGSDVCPFATYTSRSSAMDFARNNFGGEGSDCSC